MKKALKNTAIFSLIFLVGAVSLFCCCFTADVKAKTSTAMLKAEICHCHTPFEQTSARKEQEECDCEKVSAIISSRGLDTFNTDFSYLYGDCSLATASANALPKELLQSRIRHVFNQVLVSSIPILLKDCVLRI